MKQKLIELITPKNALVFLAGLAAFILALVGKDHWASDFATVALLVLLFG